MVYEPLQSVNNSEAKPIGSPDSKSISVATAAGVQKIKVEHRQDLQGGHTSTVNIVRFSPNGQYLASGSDDQMVIIWQLKSLPQTFGQLGESVQWG